MTVYSLILCNKPDKPDTNADYLVYSLQRSQSILKNLQLYQYPSQAKCGGKAICSLCRVKVLAGARHCNKPVAEELNRLSTEQLNQGWRLACQLYCLQDLRLFVPPLKDTLK